MVLAFYRAAKHLAYAVAAGVDVAVIVGRRGFTLVEGGSAVGKIVVDYRR
ncbi:hypothetical protein FHT28_002700 [Rhizobium sp. SG570]|uniref:Uncharacterized protein n=1 Tax=Rhizobium lusitanum TaxID=293958 RepID=A0A1C3UF67_9HYPH|nr:hypothetical protein [Rhizobium sp. SG570]SCB14123.1 hypothetical protein GA0061101_102273 [Rhizobium lusitanum]